MITIHGFYENRVWPLVHVLLNSKTTESYNLLFRNLLDGMRNRNLYLRPVSVSVDFELGMMVALKNNFSYIVIFGCYFHFTQAVYRKVQEFGLAKAFTSNIVVLITLYKVVIIFLCLVKYLFLTLKVS